jgi:tetratricopeptide (TPR) repeat protein
MKYKAFVVFLVIFPALIACGGSAVRTGPPHLTAGQEQIAKGMPYYQKGCYKRALEYFLKAHEIFTSYDQREGVAMSLNNLGAAYRGIDEPESALILFQEAYQIYTGIGNPAGARQALCNQTAALIDLGDLVGAEKSLDEASKITVGVEGGTFIPLMSNQGILLTKKKEYAKAEEVLKNALAASDRENLSDIAVVNSALGHLMRETGDNRQAIGYFEKALDADRKAGFHKGIADDLRYIGEAYEKLQEDRKAVESWQESIKIYALLGLEDEVDELVEQLRAAAERASVNIELTEFFVNHWLEGRMTEGLCD